MCSVVGYIGHKMGCDFILQGLERLEYRGYDSAGVSYIEPQTQRLQYAKSVGRLTELVTLLQKKPLDGHVGIGHTRWSTHGKATQENAHPHFDCHKTVSLVHNGIIENGYELRAQLVASGHVFHSETDSEVIAHMFESLRNAATPLKQTLVELVHRIDGAYAFVMIMQDKPDTMVLVRKRSPLCVGVGDNEMFVASDPVAFAGKTERVVFLPDESFAFVHKDGIELFSFTGEPLAYTPVAVKNSWDAATKQGHAHYMLKEIYEQKTAIHHTVEFLHGLGDAVWDHMGVDAATIRDLDSLSIVGCGTSWHAARIAQFFFETVALLPTRVLLASEFRYMPFFPAHKGLYIGMSQSGETADTLEALRLVNSMQGSTVALTNTASSTMVREAGGFLITQAGPEVAVASTKAFSTQLAALYWLAHKIAYEKKIIKADEFERAYTDLLSVAELLEDTIENYKFTINATLAPAYAQYTRAIFLGRHISYPFALEAALKLKEISYIFSQCYPSGELKHGPLALVDEQTPVFICSHRDPVIYQKLLGNVHEVKARGGRVFAFAFEDQHELCSIADDSVIIPRVKPMLGPLAMTGVMQYFFYAIAKELGRSIDKPRNLAKSVTVE